MRRPSGDTTRTGSTQVRASDKKDEQHLSDFVASRTGVEGFVEPRTAVSDVTLLLVAHDGEWTRRRVKSVAWAEAAGAATASDTTAAVRARRTSRPPPRG